MERKTEEQKKKEEKAEQQKLLHKMLLHEVMTIDRVEVNGKYGYLTVLRVPGGWLYTYCHDVDTQVDTEEKELTETGKSMSRKRVTGTKIARQAVMTTTFVPFNVEFNA